MAGPIVVNTEQVQATAREFSAKAEELRQLVTRANSQIEALQTEFKGVRATKIHQEWTEKRPGVTQSADVLEQTGTWLNNAATAFTQVDTQGI